MQKVLEQFKINNLLEKKLFGYNAASVVGLAGLSLLLIKKYFNNSTNKESRDLTGQVVIITGANAGIGFETAKALAKSGAKLILACRDSQRGKDAETIINKIRAGSAQFMKLDLSDLNSVRSFVTAFKEQYNRLDILVNNAGLIVQTKSLTVGGFEKTLVTNHLGPFLLTNLLLDILQKTPQFRIINVSSEAHTFEGFDLDDLNFEKRPYGKGFAAYAQSKLANILFTNSLQKRFDQGNIQGKAVSLHPGFVRTEISRNYVGLIKLIYHLGYPLYYLFSMDSSLGAQTTLHCVLKDFNRLEKGQYFDDCRVKQTNNKQITAENEDRLWELSSKLVKL